MNICQHIVHPYKDDDDNNDDKLFLRNGSLMKRSRTYFQLRTLLGDVTIANLRNAASRI